MKNRLFLIALLAAPMAAQAGSSVDVNIKNTVVQNGDGYPRLTAHITGGSNCWYDNGLADWNQYAPSGGSVSQYTETKNSGWCFFEVGIRHFTLFMQPAPNVAWVTITPQYRLFVNDNLDLNNTYANGDYWDNMNRGNNWVTNQARCGLSIQSRIDSQDPARVWFEVSGKATPDCAGYVYPVTNSASTSALRQAEPDITKTVTMKLGASKTIALNGLDPGSVWELGECTGDAVLASDAIPHNTLRKTLPATVTVRATGRGSEACDVVGWHYPEYSKVVVRRYLFNVKQ